MGLNPFGEVGRRMAQGLLSLLKPTLSGAIKKAAREYVSTGQLASLPGAGSRTPIDVGQIKGNLAKRGVHFVGVGDVAINGDSSTVELRFQNRTGGGELPVQLQMRRVEGGWQVVKWKNSTAWITREVPFTG